MKKQTIAKLVALAITIIFVAILLSQIEIGDLEAALIKLRPEYLVIGFLLYALTYFLKALRFHFLLNRSIGLKSLYSIVCAYNLAINIFPARSGELSLIYFLTKRHNKTVGEGAAILLLTRMLDIISISLIFFVYAILASNQPAMMSKVTQIAGFLMLLVVLILAIFYLYCNRFVAWLRIISIYLKMNERNFVNYIFHKMDEMVLSLSNIRRDQFLWSALISIWIWVILYFVNYALVIAMGIDIKFEMLLFASSFYFMISMLPIQGISGFGTLEGGWTLSFMAVGVAKKAAISSGFVAHFIAIFYIFILFLLDYAAKAFK